MRSTVRCLHCGNDRDPDLKSKCPICGSRRYSLIGYLYPHEGKIFRLILFISLGFLVFAIFWGLSYAIDVVQNAEATRSTQFVLESQKSTATQQAKHSTDQASTAVSSLLTQTQAAASFALMQTQIAAPSTYTPVPTHSRCPAILVANRTIYEIPSNALPGPELKAGSELEVIGKLDDSNWYQIQFGTQKGWLPEGDLQGLDKNCPTLLGVTNVLQLPGYTILDDTFLDSKGWYYTNDLQTQTQRSSGPLNDVQLEVDGYDEKASVSTDALGNISTFDLATSYYRLNGGNQSYIGVKFGDASSSFSIYIFGDCSVEVKGNSGYEEKRLTPGNSNQCRDASSDYLHVVWDGSQLTVWVNDTQFSHSFQLGSGYPASGKIELIVESARVQFNFFAITTH